MRHRPGQRRPHPIAVLVVASIVALACGAPVPHQEPPPEKIPFDDVLGVWKDGEHRTIQFRADGTFTAEKDAVAAFGPGSLPMRDDGTWRLCDSYPFEQYHDDKIGNISLDCEDTGVGEWISVDLPSASVVEIGSLIFTGDRYLSLYVYNIDSSPDREEHYYKVDHRDDLPGKFGRIRSTCERRRPLIAFQLPSMSSPDIPNLNTN